MDKGILIQTEKYLLTCYRYIELNPVRAKMVASPEEYKWTSYRTNAWGDTSSWLLPHKEYKRLGDDVEGLFLLQKTIRNQMNDDDFLWVRKAVHYCQPTGDELFAQMISKKYGIVLGQMARGGPKNQLGSALVKKYILRASPFLSSLSSVLRPPSSVMLLAFSAPTRAVCEYVVGLLGLVNWPI